MSPTNRTEKKSRLFISDHVRYSDWCLIDTTAYDIYLQSHRCFTPPHGY